MATTLSGYYVCPYIRKICHVFYFNTYYSRCKHEHYLSFMHANYAKKGKYSAFKNNGTRRQKHRKNIYCDGYGAYHGSNVHRHLSCGLNQLPNKPISTNQTP